MVKKTIKQVKPTIVIGVTGHRHIKHDDKALINKITGELHTIRDAHQGADFILLTGLAEGADRLIAKLAMKELKAILIAVLAVPEEFFMMDFANGQSKRQFKNYLKKSDVIITAPLLSKKARQDYTPSRNNQYAWIGAFIALYSNYLIAVWDGKPARGRGGTADVVRWFKYGRIPKLMLTELSKHSKKDRLNKLGKQAISKFIHLKV